jgi:hypothetical protein
MNYCRFALFALTVCVVAPACEASVTISTKATQNITCSAGICSPTAKQAVLNVSDLTNMLASGDVKIITGAGAVTITVESPFSWTSTSRLTLDAIYNVSFRAPVTVAGTGAVTITTNDGGSGGDLFFFPGAKLDFWDTRSSLVINGASYVLANDITSLAANAHKGVVALANDYDATKDHFHDFLPIHHLRGTLEGLGHIIGNLSIEILHSNCAGFIGNSNGTVRDIALTKVVIDATGPDVGVTGAFAGCNEGVLKNISATGTVNAHDLCEAAGLVGYNYSSGTISGSHADVSVYAESCTWDTTYVGGLVGYSKGIILSSYAEGNIIGGSVAGGLAGYCYGCDQTFATGSVDGSTAGGLVGIAGNVSNSYSSGMATGATVGGFAAKGCCITSSYSLGSAGGYQGYSGGFIGRPDSPSQLESNYWDEDTSQTQIGCGDGDCSGVTGLSDAQLKAGLPAGFDPAIWGRKKSINNGYPYLLANPPPQ